MKKNLFAIALALILAFGSFSMVACQDSGTDEDLKITPATLEIEQYEEQVLSLNKEGEAEWTSSDPMVVRVDKGVITSVKMGSATITAKLGEEEATCEVTVIKATKNRSLIIDCDEVLLYLGAEKDNTKTIKAELKETGKVLSGVECVWASSDPAIATVNQGVITAESSGNTKVTVSTKYKGQAFSKEINVTVRDWTHKSSQMMALSESSPSILAEYQGDVTALGFEAGTAVTQYSIRDTENHFWDNRVIAEGALTETNDFAYDRMLFDISFREPVQGDIVFWIYDKIYTFYNGNIPALGLDYSILVFDQETGHIFSGSFETKHVYTFMVILNQNANQENKSWGMSINQNTDVYFANVVCCNEDYYKDNFTQLNKPNEPYSDVYFVYGDSLEKMTDPDQDGWFEQSFAGEELYPKRVFIGMDEWTVIFNYTAMKERFDYYGFDVIFKDSIAGAVWTGGDAILLGADGSLSNGSGGVLAPEDIYIYDAAGRYVTGQTLQLNTPYSFKVKIQKEEDGVYQNLAIGIGLVQGTLSVSKPYFIKQDTPDPIPPRVDKKELSQMVSGDAQTPLQKSETAGYTDWYEQVFTADNLWGGRVYGYDAEITFTSMRNYSYFGFDIIFKDNVSDVLIWTGDAGIIEVQNNKFNASEGDIFVFDAQGKNVTGQELEIGVAYTLKIKLYGTDSNAVGLGLKAPGTIYVRNPYLMNDSQ